MRKLLFVCLLLLFAAPTFAATAPSAAASATPAVTLTPDQARQALAVLNDPQRRTQIEVTLHAIAAAGALSAPPASAPAAASAPASGAAATVHAAFESNGLASQLARQGAHGAVQVAVALRHSLVALLDVSSVRGWWTDLMNSPQQRAVLGNILLSLLGTLLPALALEWLARRLLRRAITALAVRRNIDPRELFLDEPSEATLAAQAQAASAATDGGASAASNETAASAAADAADATNHALAAAGSPPAAVSPPPGDSGAQHAFRHYSLLRRLPRAALRMAVRFVPLGVFIGASSLLMSILTDEGTPQDRALDSIIDIYVLCRVAVIVSGFFLQPDAPRLRLLQMGSTWAAFTQRWVVIFVSVIGAGSAVADTAEVLGLNEAAHLALMKVVALVAHVMISLLILQCRKPVAARIRARCAANPSLSVIGNALADSWATIGVFVVMALWFVWALDVRNGYHTLVHLGGISIAVLVGARVVSIVIFGALARLFDGQDAQANNSLVHQHAYRYYPMLRRVISWLVGVITALVLLQVWGANVSMLFESGTIGHRLASALVTIAVAAAVALFVWEAANVTVERRLHQWTNSGDLVRAARLRTLLPMLRSLLFVVIALVVVLTGLSELGVNIGPLLAGASIFGVALGFGSQKLVQDFITGIFLLMENAMQVGDWVTLAGVSGTVEYLSIRTVRLRGGDGSLYTVPFSSVSTVNNTNRGLGNAAVKVSILYGQDIDLAIATLKEIGTSLREDPQFKDGILSDFAFWGIDSVDGSAITMSGQIQCRDSGRWGVQREFNRRVADLFQARGIQIANPQRTVVVREGAPVDDAKAEDGKADAPQPDASEARASSDAADSPDASHGPQADPAAPAAPTDAKAADAANAPTSRNSPPSRQ
ncbi:mechanosensitive ion channel family protein [Paraburkholderia sp. BCC1885]|uniref:mechanosensitive ion channel family protein n=1 Tax=Paraburkholderia sp. BCC1885 TaxID=2562669 RepID=UPI001181D33B|nr:mechanosensitive ion channel domain-containing protein [Paraburkholderia sp. BCC1885]